MKKLLIITLVQYKRFISPFLYRLVGSGCRYSPTCSDYAVEAIRKCGMKRGLVLALKRFARCHPFSNHPHFDPVGRTEAQLIN